MPKVGQVDDPRLIAGLHEPQSGRILFDGVDVTTLELPARRALSSVVFQEPYLIQGTIEENVLAGDPSAGPERVAAATRLARVDEIIGRLPDGLGSGGRRGRLGVSGGERQRISIARALPKPAPVLLIDEATSALDNENERAVVDALSADDVARTRIIVAHRQAGIRHADQVIVIDDGQIAEQGTPANSPHRGWTVRAVLGTSGGERRLETHRLNERETTTASPGRQKTNSRRLTYSPVACRIRSA